LRELSFLGSKKLAGNSELYRQKNKGVIIPSEKIFINYRIVFVAKKRELCLSRTPIWKESPTFSTVGLTTPFPVWGNLFKFTCMGKNYSNP
jgi:hypothetical protein